MRIKGWEVPLQDRIPLLLRREQRKDQFSTILFPRSGLALLLLHITNNNLILFKLTHFLFFTVLLALFLFNYTLTQSNKPTRCFSLDIAILLGAQFDHNIILAKKTIFRNLCSFIFREGNKVPTHHSFKVTCEFWVALHNSLKNRGTFLNSCQMCDQKHIQGRRTITKHEIRLFLWFKLVTNEGIATFQHLEHL